MFTILWDVKEPTHYSKRVGHEVPGVVAVLCESIAGPHQLIAAKKLNLLNQIKDRQTDRREKVTERERQARKLTKQISNSYHHGQRLIHKRMLHKRMLKTAE